MKPRMLSLSSDVSIHIALWGDSAHLQVSDFQAQHMWVAYDGKVKFTAWIFFMLRN